MKGLLGYLSGVEDVDSLPLLAPQEAMILRLLLDPSEGRAPGKYGLELVAASSGKLKRNTVYIILDRMARKGFVDSRKDPNELGGRAPREHRLGPARRTYTATKRGQRVLAAWEKLAVALSREILR